MSDISAVAPVSEAPAPAPVPVSVTPTPAPAPAEPVLSTKVPASWRSLEITQDCAFGWTVDAVKAFLNGWAPVREYAYILHDKDLKEDCKTPRNPHIHLAVRFSNPVPTSAIIARAVAVGLPPDIFGSKCQFLNKVKSWSALINYLTHRDEQLPNKHVYDPSEITSNIDWELAAAPAHAKKVFSITPLREKEIIDRIASGEIKEYNISKYLTDYERIQLSRKIEYAFKIQAERAIKEEREMQVIFISGESGVGKDTFAREWCKKQHLDYFTTNNNDDFPFDDYKGEPVIIWSDARDDIFKPRALHNLLDNHYQSKQKARFRDRLLNCQYMLITSIKPLSEWYSAFYQKEAEDIVQLYRRISMQIKMTSENVTIYVYNQAQNKYEYSCTLPNTYCHTSEYYDTREKQQALVKSFLGGLAETADFGLKAIEHPEDYERPPELPPFDYVPSVFPDLIDKSNGSGEDE